MQLTHLKTLMEPSREGMCKVTAMAWAPNNKRLAVVTVDRVIHLYNDLGERRDKFSTKPSSGGPKNYIVRALHFSPDSTKLAVAQSDNIVFVYKLGLEWGAKKSICNKFQQQSPVTSLTWPSQHPNEVCFGLADGKVKVGMTKTNKPATLYSTDSYTVSMCASRDGTSILSGHVDGSIYRFKFDDSRSGPAYSKFAHHTCPPYALAWGATVCAAGSDMRVVFYDSESGREAKSLDYSNDEGVKEFMVAETNPSGQSMVIGNFDKFYVYSFDAKMNSWREEGPKVVENYYTVSSLAWKGDGSRLTVGTLCGCVDLYDACIKRSRYKGAFEFTYVSSSQVIVRKLATGARIVLKSHFGCEITKINVYAEDRYLVANTSETILCGDLESCKLSEVPWNSNGSEKFVFDNPSVCMVYASGELSLIEYGKNEILGSCRTEHMKPTLVSVRINERPPRKTNEELLMMGYQDEVATRENKKIAYLLDQLTVRVLDLTTGASVATVDHDSKIDWLELNARADKLMYRDKRRQLHLFDIASQSRTTLLTFCSYVQWVPESDVVVGQNRNNLCVWYNIEAPEKVTMHEINGEVEEITRGDGKTEVVVDEGMSTIYIRLDEALIGFGAAVEDGNLNLAVDILEKQTSGGQSMTLEAEAMWKQLSDVAILRGELAIAERCFSAMGDLSKCRFLHKVNKIAAQAAAAGGGDGQNHWMVVSKLAQLRGDYRAAEQVFLENGHVEEAVEMYQTLHKWDEAIRVAEQRNHPEAGEMKKNYFDYLISSGQEEKAAAMKEDEGDYLAAIDLFLKGRRPAKAMQVVNNHKSRNYRADLLERIAHALAQSNMHGKAGEFYERMDQLDRALESYVKGHAYRPAVELARRAFPGQVVRLEEAWGDYLVSSKNMENAINHYIEANATTKAIEASLSARQWKKAGELIDAMQAADTDAARPYYMRIARHYHSSGQFEQGAKFYVLAQCEKEAIEMYTDNNMWDAAHKLAVRYMSEKEVSSLYTQQAQTLEAKGKFKEAERLLLTVNEPDLAITMYKKARKYDNMIRLVTAYRKDLLKETHLHLAQQLEMEGALKEAEQHYSEAGDWQSAVNMYRANDMWDEAIRVAKYHGGIHASKRVAYAWAISLGGEAGSKLLTKLGLIEQAIDYAIESGSFEHAFELARNSCQSKVPEVHLKHALFLEDEERFPEENEFVKAGKPKEAIDMYIHQQDWANAMRVAEQYDPSSISDVLVAQAKLAAEQEKNFDKAENLYINAKKPELALKMYQDLGMWPEAMKFAKKQMPHKLQDVNLAYQRAQDNPVAAGGGSGGGGGGGAQRSPSGGGKEVLEAARMWEEARDYPRAIDAYLAIDASKVSDPDDLERAWESAVKIASRHAKPRYREVVVEVAERLHKLERFNAAAELYKDVEMFKESIDCYIAAHNWPKAKALCATAPAYTQFVEKAYRKHLVSQGAADDLVDTGEVGAALQLYAQRGEWKKLFEVVTKDAPHLGGRFAGEFAGELLANTPVQVA